MECLVCKYHRVVPNHLDSEEICFGSASVRLGNGSLCPLPTLYGSGGELLDNALVVVDACEHGTPIYEWHMEA